MLKSTIKRNGSDHGPDRHLGRSGKHIIVIWEVLNEDPPVILPVTAFEVLP
jgi:hypothetical protein